MANVTLDALGLKCPQPVLKIASKSTEMFYGDTLEVLADCPTFEKDVRLWCERIKKRFCGYEMKMVVRSVARFSFEIKIGGMLGKAQGSLSPLSLSPAQ